MKDMLMTIASQNAKVYLTKRDELMLKAQIRAFAEDFKNNEETENCWVDCVAIMLNIDNDDYIRKVVSGIL